MSSRLVQGIPLTIPWLYPPCIHQLICIKTATPPFFIPARSDVNEVLVCTKLRYWPISMQGVWGHSGE
jgi:hypothetical protein